MQRRPRQATRTDTLLPDTTLVRARRQRDPRRQPCPTRDGYLAIVPYTPESTARLMALLGSDGLTETPEFQAAKAKGQHMPIVYSEIARKTPAKTTAEWLRSEERRVGKECVSTCRSRGSPYH